MKAPIYFYIHKSTLQKAFGFWYLRIKVSYELIYLVNCIVL